MRETRKITQIGRTRARVRRLPKIEHWFELACGCGWLSTRRRISAKACPRCGEIIRDA